MTRFVIQRTADGWYWHVDNRWTLEIGAARWFASEHEAELAGLRELHEHRIEWRVRETQNGRTV